MRVARRGAAAVAAAVVIVAAVIGGASFLGGGEAPPRVEAALPPLPEAEVAKPPPEPAKPPPEPAKPAHAESAAAPPPPTPPPGPPPGGPPGPPAAEPVKLAAAEPAAASAGHGAAPSAAPAGHGSAPAVASSAAAPHGAAPHGAAPGPAVAAAAGAGPPWQRYARPFELRDRRARIALVIAGLGPRVDVTEAALKRLPGEVTLGFSPYALRLQEWIDKARADGHEAVIAVPMEPFDFPRQDPGPNTLLVSLDAKENLARLDWVLNRATGYVGVVSLMGSRFTSSPLHLRPVLEVVKSRGLLFLDSGASPQSATRAIAAEIGLPRAINDRVIDAEESRASIDRRLAELEDAARRNGKAVGMGVAYPATIDRILEWAPGLAAKGFVLAPLSAVVAGPQPSGGG